MSNQPIARWVKNSYIQFFGGYPKDGTLLYAYPIVSIPLNEERVIEIAKECNFDITEQLLCFVHEIEKAQQHMNDQRLSSDIKATK